MIPAYNVELYLQETLDSVYAQTFDKYEIIVVDDGSTDGTPEMLARQNDPRLRVIRQQKRQAFQRPAIQELQRPREHSSRF